MRGGGLSAGTLGSSKLPSGCLVNLVREELRDIRVHCLLCLSGSRSRGTILSDTKLLLLAEPTSTDSLSCSVRDRVGHSSQLSNFTCGLKVASGLRKGKNFFGDEVLAVPRE
mmetsp:Transcript_18530/g.49722  ORF Transcript_18530/g.49722 Transcript_18530/m.49722 type:complete len:112 (-) Transcript_18530:102-437(-)